MKKVEIDTTSKPFKYYKAKKLGKEKKEAALIAGYSPSVARIPQSIEKTEQYRAIETHFRDQLLAKITVSEVADALVDNIKQENMKVIDRGSRNKAIEIAKNWIEPDSNSNDEEGVVIILKQ